MRAAVIEAYGGTDRFALREVPEPPAPGTGELLVRVRAAGVNPMDAKLRSGKFRLFVHERFPLVLGSDLAGEVEAVGPEVTDFEPGDRVFGSALRIGRGSYAERTLAKANQVAPIPDRLSFVEAAALPGSGCTALQALRDVGEVQSDERVLIHGAAGGVGHLAIQIARLLGARATGTASALNLDFLRDLGAERAIDYREVDFTLEDEQYAVVFDVVGNRSFPQCQGVLSEDGGIYVTTRPGPGVFFWWAASGLRSRIGPKQRARWIIVRTRGADLLDLASWADRGLVRPSIEEVIPLAEVWRGHERIDDGHVRGKLVLEID